MNTHTDYRRDRATPHPGALRREGDGQNPGRLPLRKAMTCAYPGCTTKLHRNDSRKLGRCPAHWPRCSVCGLPPRKKLVKGQCEQCYAKEYRRRKLEELAAAEDLRLVKRGVAVAAARCGTEGRSHHGQGEVN